MKKIHTREQCCILGGGGASALSLAKSENLTKTRKRLYMCWFWPSSKRKAEGAINLILQLAYLFILI